MKTAGPVAVTVGRSRRERRKPKPATKTAERTGVRKRQDVTQQRKVAFWKSAKLFHSNKAKYDGALRGNHAAYFPIHVLLQALSGASRRHEFRECAAQFLPSPYLSQQHATKEVRQ